MNDIITSVLGFNMKVEIRDQDGNIIKTGAKTTYPLNKKIDRKKGYILDKSFFTNFNEALLAKIRDYRRIND